MKLVEATRAFEGQKKIYFNPEHFGWIYQEDWQPIPVAFPYYVLQFRNGAEIRIIDDPEDLRRRIDEALQ